MEEENGVSSVEEPEQIPDEQLLKAMQLLKRSLVNTTAGEVGADEEDSESPVESATDSDAEEDDEDDVFRSECIRELLGNSAVKLSERKQGASVHVRIDPQGQKWLHFDYKALQSLKFVNGKAVPPRYTLWSNENFPRKRFSFSQPFFSKLTLQSHSLYWFVKMSEQVAKHYTFELSGRTYEWNVLCKQVCNAPE
eukprot:CAMPEP_0118953206 /NCGR_PEP_ID=MMETSP1169-20130426/56165_1 /TAXON_ID=36882 /ORGANISM="Pyramimonas obovata, Strain CCMP722" /LENGTH=194 /DNA_ID=CAMNT_0006900607 /DNA_START=82 /DNA_END=663 /DNA_ORIENTATION=-